MSPDDDDQEGDDRTRNECRKPELPVARRGHQQDEGGRRDPQRRQLAAERQRRDFADVGHRRVQRMALGPSQCQIGRCDRQHRRQREYLQPHRQRRHLRAEHDEIGRIGNRQHETRRVRNEGADQEIRQRLDLRRPGCGIYRRRQHHRGGVVGEEHRHQRADAIHDQEQPLGRAVGMAHGPCRKPVEQALLAGDFREQHHADQEEIDIEPFGCSGNGLAPRQQVQQHQQHRAGQRPDEFRQPPGPHDHAEGGEGGDAPGGGVERCDVDRRRHRAHYSPAPTAKAVVGPDLPDSPAPAQAGFSSGAKPSHSAVETRAKLPSTRNMVP